MTLLEIKRRPSAQELRLFGVLLAAFVTADIPGQPTQPVSRPHASDVLDSTAASKREARLREVQIIEG